jgi:predicted transcriptional regulator
MKYKRSRTDIICQILETANGSGVTKARITYKVFLSYAQMKEYLIVLTKSDLLSYDLDTQTFKTTEKGLRFLTTYNQIDQLMDAHKFGHNSDREFR